MNNSNDVSPQSSAQDKISAYREFLRPHPGVDRPFTKGELFCLGHAHRVVKLRYLFGFDGVFVPIAPRTKAPTHMGRGFPSFDLTKMEDQEYLAELERNNIALLTGPASGNLVTLDFDRIEAADKFLRLNASLFENGFRVNGRRAFNLLMRLQGKYPVGCFPIKDQDGLNVGEFRAGNCLTVIDGIHPDGISYKIEGEHAPILEFGQINWPTEWRSKCIRDEYARLVEKFGEPYTKTKHGGVVINEPWFAGKFATEHLMLHDPALGLFQYHHVSGVWVPKTSAAVAEQFSNDLKDAADAFGEPAILTKRTSRFLESLVSHLRGQVEECDAFATRSSHVIHTIDGMLDLSSGQPVLKPFSPCYRSLHSLPWRYDTNAACPRFLNELLGAAMSVEDIALLQKLCGQILLGQNLTQKLLVLEGPGGSGKGTFSEILDSIIGERNVGEIRTAHLPGRFELSAFVGKLLLCGRDVPGSFLNGPGASYLKKLTGGDLLELEVKGRQTRGQMRGDFSIFITTNSRLLIAIEGDKSAWHRRLVILAFERGRVVKPIPNFARLLLREEGPGIFAWMVQGAISLLEDIRDIGTIRMNSTQLQRVNDVLTESDSIMSFLTKRTVEDPSSSVHTASLYQAYRDYCANNGFETLQERTFEKRVKGEILDLHGAQQSENVIQFGFRRRGYVGVRLLGSGELDVVGPPSHP